MFPKLKIALAVALSFGFCSLSHAAKKPLQVYILAGQSNMQGSAHKSTFAAMGDDPVSADLLKEILDKNGNPVVAKNAWISYLTQGENGDTSMHGRLEVGYGFDNDRFGPEYAFGLFMDKALKEPILIIKTAWGGKSLAVDFRPPGAGPYEPSTIEKERGNIPKSDEVGHYYREMIRYIQSTLKNTESIRKIVPGYTSKQGYELAGFVWFQGWNDMCNRHHIEQYTENMIHFISDVRKELDSPSLPFIVGILGVYGTDPDSRKFDKNLPVSDFRRAQFAAVEQYDQKAPEQYRGHVIGVDSGPFYELELSDIYWKRRLTNEWEWKVKEGKMTPEEAKKERERYGFTEGGLTEQEQMTWDRCASNAEYHYLGSGKTFIRFGRALAEAMVCHIQACSNKAPETQDADSLFALFQNPEPTSRAFVRWWWNGNRVNETEVIRELDLLKEAGFGGVEINPIKMPPLSDEPNQKQLEWLSSEWNQVLKTACLGAKERGMVADLLVGSGWPFGGKFLHPDQTIERMAVNYKEVNGPVDLKLPIADLEDDLPPAYLSDPMERQSERKLSFVRLIPQNIHSSDQIIDLSAFIEGDQVRYTIPAGNFILTWGVLQKGYREVVHGTLGAEGPTMDHFNSDVVLAFLNRLLEIEKDLGIPLDQLIRALFADSMELAGSNWCQDLAREFSKRCGYSLEPWLPFVLYYYHDPYPFPIDDPSFSDQVLRARYDYTKTLVELFHERFTATFQQFCTDHGLKCRYQAYGNPWLMGMLDGYMAVDIPESNNWFYSQNTKPDDEEYFTWSRSHGYMIWNKYASSAAHLTAKKIVSCEAMTNTGGVFQASLSTIKQAGDMNFISGINHSVLHGFNYSPPEAGFPGWVRYGTYFSEHNTLWPHFKNWVDYDARISSVLQNTDPVVDIAILPPESDHWSKHGLIREPFHTEPWYVFELWQAISQNGSSCDYVNEKIIRDAVMKNGCLEYGPMSYKTLILADVASLEAESIEALYTFVSNGGNLICIGQAPVRSSSFLGKTNDSLIHERINQIKALEKHVLFTAAPDSTVNLTQWVSDIFAKAGHSPDVRIAHPDRSLYQIHHRQGSTDIYFVTNTNRKRSISNQLTTDLGRKSVWKWNPETGHREPVLVRRNTIEIELNPLESCLLVIQPATSRYSAKKPIAIVAGEREMIIDSEWTAVFHPVEGPEFSRTFTVLPDFKTSNDTLIQNFAGVVVYQTRFDSESDDYHFLDLGNINEGVAEVRLNGKDLPKHWYGQPIIKLEEQLKPGTNDLEITYTSLLSNYCRSLDAIEAKRWIGKRELLSNGLCGPVSFK